MNSENFENKLTPAAKEILEALTKEYKSRVLLKAQQNAIRFGELLDEITVRDILEGAKLADNKEKNKLSNKIKSITNSYIIIGTTITSIGLSFWIMNKILMSEGISYKTSFIIVISGLCIILLSYILRAFFKYKFSTTYDINKEIDASMIFVVKWQEIERLIKNLASSLLGESYSRKPISSLIRKIVDVSSLKKEDEKIIKEILTIRNDIVHSDSHIHQAKIIDAIKKSRKLEDRLRSLLNNMV